MAESVREKCVWRRCMKIMVGCHVSFSPAGWQGRGKPWREARLCSPFWKRLPVDIRICAWEDGSGGLLWKKAAQKHELRSCQLDTQVKGQDQAASLWSVRWVWGPKLKWSLSPMSSTCLLSVEKLQPKSKFQLERSEKKKCRNRKTKARLKRLGMKRRQGSLALPPGLRTIFWAMSCELSHRYWNPQQVQKLTTRRPDWHQDISGHHSENWPQANGSKPTLEGKTNRTYKNQDDTDQTTGGLLQHDRQSWLHYFCMYPPRFCL